MNGHMVLHKPPRGEFIMNIVHGGVCSQWAHMAQGLTTDDFGADLTAVNLGHFMRFVFLIRGVNHFVFFAQIQPQLEARDLFVGDWPLRVHHALPRHHKLDVPREELAFVAMIVFMFNRALQEVCQSGNAAVAMRAEPNTARIALWGEDEVVKEGKGVEVAMLPTPN